MSLLLTTSFKGNLFPYGLPVTLSPITIISHHSSLSALSLFKGVLFCLFLFWKNFFAPIYALLAGCVSVAPQPLQHLVLSDFKAFANQMCIKYHYGLSLHFPDE